MPWTQLEISTLVLLGTVLQAYLALTDIAVAKRDAVRWWEAEGELRNEARRRDRRAVARELRSWRDPDTHRGIVHTKIALAGWILLAVASALAVLVSALALLN